ncbi:MAG: hypothetical protein A3F46_01775 [Legionellales bacterium RIFCSPHIGHO2_12_FULL_42_9]|nr:MAG: hypothetical protein A3F46_01775 [Legionellales bacterium RIFCSPHIGHO2_12_FULL_42_9]
MAAQAAEFYTTGKNSWKIGADIIKPSSGLGAIRYMDLPSRDGKSIDSADKYRDNMNVFYASGVFDRLFYLLANSPQWNTKKAFDVMVKANIGYWTPTSTFKEAACGVIEATKDLNYAVADVKKALDVVKIDYKSCRV